MSEDAVKPSAHNAVMVVPATPEQEPILANLLQLYAHDFSEFHEVELGPDGRFAYRELPLIWSESGRHPFLVELDGKLAGFVLVKRGSEISANEAVWDMAEFFVIRGYRRRGIGTQVAREVWGRFPGRWQVRVMQSNMPACEFWARAILESTGAGIQPVPVEQNGDCWNVFSFECDAEV